MFFVHTYTRVFGLPGASRTLRNLLRSSQNGSWSISRKFDISWKSRFFGVTPEHFHQEEIRPENRIDKTNASLDSLRLGARGKPSTFVYRAGWLVEPFHVRFQIVPRDPNDLAVTNRNLNTPKGKTTFMNCKKTIDLKFYRIQLHCRGHSTTDGRDTYEIIIKYKSNIACRPCMPQNRRKRA